MNFIKTKFFFSFVFLVSAMLALGAVYWVGTQNDLKAIQILSYRKISFLQSSCSRYEHFVLGSDTKDLLSLREKAVIEPKVILIDLYLRIFHQSKVLMVFWLWMKNFVKKSKSALIQVNYGMMPFQVSKK